MNIVFHLVAEVVDGDRRCTKHAHLCLLVLAFFHVDFDLWDLLESVTVPCLVSHGLSHELLQPTMDDQLPELAERVTFPAWNQTFALNVQPEGGATGVSLCLLRRQRYLKNLDAFGDCVPDVSILKRDALAAFLFVLEGVELVGRQQAALLDALDDPVTLEHVAPEVLRLRHVLGNRCNLIREAFMDLTGHSSMLLD